MESMKATLESTNTRLLAAFQENLTAVYTAALVEASVAYGKQEGPSQPTAFVSSRFQEAPSQPLVGAGGGEVVAWPELLPTAAAEPRPISAISVLRAYNGARPISVGGPSAGVRPASKCTFRPVSKGDPQRSRVVPFIDTRDGPEVGNGMRMSPVAVSFKRSSLVLSATTSDSSNGKRSKSRENLQSELTFSKRGPPISPGHTPSRPVLQRAKPWIGQNTQDEVTVEDAPKETYPSDANLSPHRRVSISSQVSNRRTDSIGIPTHDVRVFQDVTALKQQVRQTLVKPEYNVTQLYHDTGFWQAIARHKYFDNFMLWVIMLNTIWIAVDTDLHDADYVLQAPVYAQVIEHAFTVVMSLEVVIRFCSFRSKISALKDRSFVFDASLVAFQIFETWIMTFIILLFIEDGGDGGVSGVSNTSVLRIFRLLRIFRMARVARLLNAAPELMVLVKGVVSASRSVFLTLCLLFVVLFIFSVGFRQITKDTGLGQKYFSSIINSMFSLLVYGTIPDQASIIVDATSANLGYGLLVLLYIFVAYLTVLNLLVGVIVQVVNVVSAVENEEIAVKDVRRRLMAAVESTVESGWDGENTVISRDDFQTLVTQADIVKALDSLRVDCVSLLESEDIIFSTTNLSGGFPEPADSITFGAFMEVVMQMRGANQATVKDMLELRKYMQVTVAAAVGELVDVLGVKGRASQERWRRRMVSKDTSDEGLSTDSDSSE